jgi:hypothetical protein
MIYFLDGYNLLFSLTDSKQSLAVQRGNLILYLQKRFASLKLKGMIVFDGAHRRNEESGLSYRSPLEIAYAPKGQSADAYIVERIESSKNPKLIAVVTNDRGLGMHARSHGAKVLSNESFIRYLHKIKRKQKKADVKESPKNIERLSKIFEERLEKGEEDPR